MKSRNCSFNAMRVRRCLKQFNDDAQSAQHYTARLHCSSIDDSFGKEVLTNVCSETMLYNFERMELCYCPSQRMIQTSYQIVHATCCKYQLGLIVSFRRIEQIDKKIINRLYLAYHNTRSSYDSCHIRNYMPIVYYMLWLTMVCSCTLH